MLVDSHCHLADGVFADDLDEVVARARAAGVGAALCVLDAGSREERDRAGRLVGLWPAVVFSVGVHPHQAGAYAGRVDEVVPAVCAGLAEHAAVAVGEIGLDYHYDFAPRSVQRDVLGVQVRLAADRNLPVVIHAREAENEVIEIVRAEGRGSIRGVFHCYTGDTPTLHRVLDLGFCVGFGGIVTFPRGRNVRELLARTPFDRVLVETDSPFLAPVPHRGKRNEPALVTVVAEAVGTVVGRSAESVAEGTTRTATALFSLPIPG